MSELVIRKKIEIAASPEKVWKVLTDNEFIKQYMFNCYAETDWKPGSPLLWKAAADGKLYVKGQVVAVDPPGCLVYTVIDPNSRIPDIPANYLTMSFTSRGETITAPCSKSSRAILPPLPKASGDTKKRWRAMTGCCRGSRRWQRDKLKSHKP